MKLMKNMSLVGMGMVAVLAYQKYNKQIMCKMNEFMNNMINKEN